MRQKIISLTLTLCILLTCVSIPVFADGSLTLLNSITDGVFPTSNSNWIYSVDGNTITQPSDGLGGKAADDAYSKIANDGSKKTHETSPRAGLIMVTTKNNSTYFTKDYFVYSVNIYGDTPVTFIMRKTSTGTVYTGAAGDLKQNQWNNLKVVYNRSTYKAQLYINGVAHGDEFTVSSAYRDGEFRLQLMDMDADYYYIDDLAIYNSDTEPTIAAPVMKDADSGEYALAEGNMLIPAEGATVSSLNVDEGTTVRVYTNDEYSYQLSDTDTLTDGCKIVLVKDNIYTYYTVSTSINADYNLIYSTKFSGSTYDEGMTLGDSSYCTAAYSTGVAGKTAGDTSLNFARDAATAASSGYLGSNIYTSISVPADKAFIKYELNFMPGDDNFLKAGFLTSGFDSISDDLMCLDAGSGDTYALARRQWNKLTYVFEATSATEEEIAGTYTLYVNANEVATGDATLIKETSGDTTYTQLIFAVYGNDTAGEEDGTTNYSAISCYIDDIEVRWHESTPAIRQMPYAIDDDGQNATITGNTYTIYTALTAADITVCDGASYVVYDEPSFQYTLADAAQLYINNVIVVSDRYNQYTYYTVDVQPRNKAVITPYSGYYIAKTNLKDAVMFVAGYDDEGALKAVKYTDDSGNVSVRLDDTYGEFDVVKAIILDSISKFKPLSAPTTYVANAVVACWGDSITNGQGATDRENDTYPATLARLSGLNVFNMGIGGETQVTIAARQGALDIKLTEDITIPATCTPVDIDFLGYFKSGDLAGKVVPRNEDINGWNPVEINGVKGKLVVEVTTSGNPRDIASATFTRAQVGEAVTAKKGDLILTDGRNHNAMADITVILATINGGWTTENNYDYNHESLIKILDEMIAHAKDPSKYIIIGPVTCQMKANKVASLTATVEALRAKYGNHFLDLRGYLASEQALTDAGIIPTATDLADLANGHIPSSFGSGDTVHLNSAGYERAGHKLYEKLIELGYCTAK